MSLQHFVWKLMCSSLFYYFIIFYVYDHLWTFLCSIHSNFFFIISIKFSCFKECICKIWKISIYLSLCDKPPPAPLLTSRIYIIILFPVWWIRVSKIGFMLSMIKIELNIYFWNVLRKYSFNATDLRHPQMNAIHMDIKAYIIELLFFGLINSK